MLHQLSLQREASEKEEEAYRILEEKISRYTLTGRFQAKEAVLYRNTSYFIEWKEKGDDYEVCISIKKRQPKALFHHFAGKGDIPFLI